MPKYLARAARTGNGKVMETSYAFLLFVLLAKRDLRLHASPIYPAVLFDSLSVQTRLYLVCYVAVHGRLGKIIRPENDAAIYALPTLKERI